MHNKEAFVNCINFLLAENADEIQKEQEQEG